MFDSFLSKVEFIRPRFMTPLMVALSIAVTTLIAPFAPKEELAHEFVRPQAEVYQGETMEITPDYNIVIAENATAAEKNAAEKLQKYLNEISGTSLDIVTDAETESDKEIIVGKTAREGEDYTVARENLGDDGVVIKTVGDKIVLSGAEKRGAVYAVYTFLEDYFNCRWFTHDLTVIPKAETLTVPKNIDYSYAPKITYRSTDWISPSKSEEYKAANMLNDCVYGNMSESYGGGISYAGGFCHTFAYLVDTSLIETEPEVFALGVESGERTTDQLCLTNPRTLELAIQGVRRWLEQNPGAKIVSVTQNDNKNYCVCDNCKKVDEEEGSHAGTNIRFVNAIADNIKDDYPDVMVDTFAYLYTRIPPKHVVPRDNVIIRLCSIECKFSSPLDRGEYEENAKFAEDIKQWSKIAKNLHIWDYTTNYYHYLAPFGNFDVLQENIKFFADHNVIGIYEEGNYSAAASDGEFAELRSYMLARLLWNPDEDIDKLMYEFCDAYYGSGADSIVSFINYIDSHNGGLAVKFDNWWITPFIKLNGSGVKTEKGMWIYSDITSPETLKVKKCDVRKIDKLWQTAKDGAQTDWQRENVERSEICWRYWKACNYKGEFTTHISRYKEYQKLYDDLRRFGITQLAEGSNNVLLDNPDLHLSPKYWR